MADRRPTAADEVDQAHPLVVAVGPLVGRLGAVLVAAPDATESDVPLVWEGETVAAVRLADPGQAGTGEAVADLDTLLRQVAGELGGPLSELSRPQKQHAVRLLEERGAFEYRRSAESVAEALGVTRFTVYNYLNRNKT